MKNLTKQERNVHEGGRGQQNLSGENVVCSVAKETIDPAERMGGRVLGTKKSSRPCGKKWRKKKKNDFCEDVKSKWRN